MSRQQHAAQVGTAIILAVLMMAGAALANGQAKPGAAGLAYMGATRARAGAPPASTARFTLEFVDADIVDVFQALATQSGVNVALSGSVKGKTTLRLHNVTLEQAMNIVTKLNGLDYAWVDAAYVVGTPEEVRAMRVSELRTSVVVLRSIAPESAQQVLSKVTPDVTVSTQKGSRTVLLLGPESSLAKAERTLAEIDVPAPPSPPTTEVLAVRYLKADQMSEIITTALPDVVVQPGPQENSLLITANGQQWDAVKSLAAAADVIPPPSQATTAVYYVKYSSPTELQKTLQEIMPDSGLTVTLAPRTYTPVVQAATGGAGESAKLLAAPQLAAGGGAGGAAGGGAAGVTIEAAPVTALILSGAPYVVEHGLKLLEDLDKAPRQIHIAALVTEINREDRDRLGVDWFDLGAQGVQATLGEPILDAKTGTYQLPDVTAMPLPARGLEVGKIVRSPLQWRAAIHALEERQRARVLSAPSVTTLDGRQTALHTGDTIYYEVAIAGATTGTVITDVRTVDVGVKLLVNPRANDNGEITLTISPSVSTASTGTKGLPIISEQAVITTVRVKSGETVVLAGLVSDKDQVTVSRVPFLSNIPLLGELFKYRYKNPVHQEVMIFVTPTIVGA
jgi:general secretion pathway protein D